MSIIHQFNILFSEDHNIYHLFTAIFTLNVLTKINKYVHVILFELQSILTVH